MSNFHGEATNFRGAMSNFSGEATNFRGEATGGNQWPLHKWIYYINEVKTHILVTHRRSQEPEQSSGLHKATIRVLYD